GLGRHRRHARGRHGQRLGGDLALPEREAAPPEDEVEPAGVPLPGERGGALAQVEVHHLPAALRCLPSYTHRVPLACPRNARPRGPWTSVLPSAAHRPRRKLHAMRASALARRRTTARAPCRATLAVSRASCPSEARTHAA